LVGHNHHPSTFQAFSSLQTSPASNFPKFAIIQISPSSKIQTSPLRYEDYGHVGGWGLLPLCGVGEGSDVPLAQRDAAAAARCGGGGLIQRCSQLWWAADGHEGPQNGLKKIESVGGQWAVLWVKSLFLVIRFFGNSNPNLCGTGVRNSQEKGRTLPSQ